MGERSHGRPRAARPLAGVLVGAAILLVLVLVAAATRLPAAPGAGEGAVDEAAIRASLRAAADGGTLDREAAAALADGDLALARQLAAVGDAVARPLSPETLAAIEEASALPARILAAAGDFAAAFATGRADTAAGLAGAVASDLTLVGDVRDLVREGGRALAGEPHSELLLGLAVAGIAAEGAVIATGGTSIAAKVGLSVTKAAYRSGHLSAALARRMVDLARTARMPARRGGADAGAAAARAGARAELSVLVGDLGAMARNAGPAEAVRLLRHADEPARVRDLARFTGHFGERARAVARVTGRTALRAFRSSARLAGLAFLALVDLLAGLAAFAATAILWRAYRATVAAAEAVLVGGGRLLAAARSAVPPSVVAGPGMARP